MTGPSGAGKSTVAQVFEENGCSVIDCDRLAHDVLDQNEDCIRELCEVFGSDILDENGKIIRKRLGEKAFADTKGTQQLNAVTHPHILEEIGRRLEQDESDARFQILDAPTLIESGAIRFCDVVVCVTAPVEIRKERIRKRDGISESQISARFAAQKDDQFYSEHAGYVLDGSDEHSVLANEVSRILHETGDKLYE